MPVGLKTIGNQRAILSWASYSRSLQKQVTFSPQPSIYLTGLHEYKSQGSLDIGRVLNSELWVTFYGLFFPTTGGKRSFGAQFAYWLLHQWND